MYLGTALGTLADEYSVGGSYSILTVVFLYKGIEGRRDGGGEKG